MSRKPLDIIAENTELTADAIDSIRHDLRNVNQPVLAALGEVMLSISGLSADLKQVTEHYSERLKSHDEQLQTLRKALFSGNTSAE